MAVISFKQHLNESVAATGKLTHLQHLEDLLLDEGSAGIELALEVLREFHRMLKDGGVSQSMDVRTKWDGAPSVVFGIDPSDKRFFVATKAAFSKTPKLMKSHEDIAREYGESGVGKKLHTCLSELALLQPKGVWQGDLIFTDDVTERQIDGKSYLTFRPNTIMYAVEKDSDFGKRVASAYLGIILHSQYAGSGKSLADYRVVPTSAVAFSRLVHSSRVVAVDNTFDDVSGSVTFTTNEESDFTLTINRIETLTKNVSSSTVAYMTQTPLHDLVQMFLNSRVRGGQHAGAGNKALADLLSFLLVRRDEEAAKRKSAQGQESVRQRFDAYIADLTKHKNEIIAWFDLHAALNDAKIQIVRKLNMARNVATFVPTAHGLKSTGHEGFVAVSHSGRMVKLVDRLEFSRNNFLVPKQWS